MLERTMKYFGAAVVFLAVNNVLTASTVDSPRALTTEDLNKDVTAYTVASNMSTASPKEEIQVFKTEDGNISSNDTKKLSGSSNRGIKIGASCVAAVITVIVLVVIYKICQKKPPAVENTGVKMSAETKENVKLLSVKTEAPNSDTKRTSSNQMECIEC
ncbi:PREDICTED: endomucin [Nanorana parkeri]|uniref:endomucin n=1 Tax=Nanorana parkeri TaxID=125878 RepID=UPI0008547C8A|nr:PREDICTED: endomucin [Nanorana parkeri]